MKLSQFIESTKDYSPDTEIVVAGGMDVLNGIASGSLSPSENYPRTAQVFSIANAADAIILEL